MRTLYPVLYRWARTFCPPARGPRWSVGALAGPRLPGKVLGREGRWLEPLGLGQGPHLSALVPVTLLCSVASGTRRTNSGHPEPKATWAWPRARPVSSLSQGRPLPLPPGASKLLPKHLKGVPPAPRARLRSPRADHLEAPHCTGPGIRCCPCPLPVTQTGPELWGHSHSAPAGSPRDC